MTARLALLILLATAGVAQAQTVIHVVYDSDPSTARFDLYLPVDPALVQAGSGRSTLVSAKDGTELVRVSRTSDATCDDWIVQTLSLAIEVGWNLRSAPAADWVPTAYHRRGIGENLTAMDVLGIDSRLCLVRADGVFTPTILSTGDLPALVNALEGLVAATSSPPEVPTAAAETYAVGDVVEGRWKNAGWYRGKIAAVHPDGTFDIAYDDGDFEAHVPVDRISPLDGAAAATPTTTTTTASDGPRSQREPRGYPYGIGVALQYDYYNAYGFYRGRGLPPDVEVRNELSNTGLSLALDYDSRRAVPRPGSAGGHELPGGKLVGGARAMAGKVSGHGVAFDLQGWLGYRLGFVRANVTPMVGVGGDGVGLDADLYDGGFPSAGYWLIGASLNGERGEALDSGFDLTIVRLGRIGDDIVDSEVRFTGTFSLRGWFLGASAHFYGRLGVSSLIAGKRF